MKNCLAPGRWAPENRERLEETIRRNAFQGKYACFDFDDTTSVHAVDHALFAYQVHMLRFAMDPERMREALTTGLDDPDRVLGRNQEGRTVRCGDIVQDLCRDYDLLWRSGAAGAKEEALSAVRQLPEYQDLAAKIHWMRGALDHAFPIEISYPWCLYLLSGFTPVEVYRLGHGDGALRNRDALFAGGTPGSGGPDFHGRGGGPDISGGDAGPVPGPSGPLTWCPRPRRSWCGPEA